MHSFPLILKVEITVYLDIASQLGTSDKFYDYCISTERMSLCTVTGAEQDEELFVVQQKLAINDNVLVVGIGHSFIYTFEIDFSDLESLLKI